MVKLTDTGGAPVLIILSAGSRVSQRLFRRLACTFDVANALGRRKRGSQARCEFAHVGPFVLRAGAKGCSFSCVVMSTSWFSFAGGIVDRR